MWRLIDNIARTAYGLDIGKTRAKREPLYRITSRAQEAYLLTILEYYGRGILSGPFFTFHRPPSKVYSINLEHPLICLYFFFLFMKNNLTDKPFQKQTASNSGRYDENILALYNDYFATRRDDRDRHAPVVDVRICEELNETLLAKRDSSSSASHRRPSTGSILHGRRGGE